MDCGMVTSHKTWRKFGRAAWVLSTVICVLSAVTIGAARAQEVKEGRITGKLLDADNGEPLVGASIYIAGTKLGAMSDVSGYYMIRRVPEGKHTLTASLIGYQQVQVQEVEVTAGQTTTIDISLKLQLISTQDVVVVAKSVKNTEASLLKERQKATSVSDAISSEAISRSGGGNAAQAMIRVTGAAIADGKYAVIRGLSDRYTNTQLNGSVLPSADPEKQAFNMDLVPSDLLDNIVVTKSFTADQQGNFTGGSVNLVTKDFPETRTANFSMGSSFNTNVTGKQILGNSTSSTDWLGYDNGMRDMPKFIQDNLGRVPQRAVFYYKPTNSGDALFLDSVSKSFAPEFNPRTRTAPLNQNYSLSYGDNINLFGRSLGLVGNLAYSRKQSAYRNGDENLYVAITSSSLDPVDVLKDDRGSDEVLWGGLLSLHYSLSTHNKIGINYVRNQSGKSETRFLRGVQNDYGPGSVFESHDVNYVQRSLRDIQFNGVHDVTLGFPITFQWRYSNARTVQNQNLRSYAYSIAVDSTMTPWDTSGLVFSSSLPPAVYWRDVDEKNHQLNLDFKVALAKRTNFKFGSSFFELKREQRNTVLKYIINNTTLLDSLHGNMDAWAQHAGLSDSSGRFYMFDNYLYEWPSATDDYNGSQSIPAWYVQLETPVIAKLNLVAGLRHERTDMEAIDLELHPGGGKIHSSDWLPAVNFIYNLTPNMNLRAAYGRTLARPNLREMARFRSLDFAASKYFYGNDNLRETKISNYDLRWEWFLRPNEIVAVSAFYKKFVDPIEIAYTTDNYDRHPVNSPQAKNFGVEFEVRKQLDQVASFLSNFSAGGNLTLVHSAVTIPTDEYNLMKAMDPGASRTRPMANQSPYILNVNIGYDNQKTHTVVTALYNVFGRRFFYNSAGAAPDIYEMPRRQLDMTLTQNIWRGVTFKAAAANIFNARFEADYYYTGSGQKVLFRSYDLGRSFSIGMGYKIF